MEASQEETFSPLLINGRPFGQATIFFKNRSQIRSQNSRLIADAFSFLLGTCFLISSFSPPFSGENVVFLFLDKTIIFLLDLPQGWWIRTAICIPPEKSDITYQGTTTQKITDCSIKESDAR